MVQVTAYNSCIFMQMEQIIAKFKETYLDPNFRLFVTALPHPEFPLGLLQMSTKVTNEPPAGLKAGVLRSYTVLVDQDRLERVDGERGKMWRQLLFALCFLHSTVQERRKFGSIGWCIPYEYSTGDITACIMFLEKHLYNGEISWDTFQYVREELFRIFSIKYSNFGLFLPFCPPNRWLPMYSMVVKLRMILTGDYFKHMRSPGYKQALVKTVIHFLLARPYFEFLKTFNTRCLQD